MALKKIDEIRPAATARQFRCRGLSGVLLLALGLAEAGCAAQLDRSNLSGEHPLDRKIAAAAARETKISDASLNARLRGVLLDIVPMGTGRERALAVLDGLSVLCAEGPGGEPTQIACIYVKTVRVRPRGIWPLVRKRRQEYTVTAYLRFSAETDAMTYLDVAHTVREVPRRRN